VAVEVACVVAALAVLLSIGFATFGSVRLAARVSLAQSNLRQVGTGMELYYRHFGCYPPQGCDLAAELEPFVDDPNAFRNPLMDEEQPGQTISLLYRAPTPDEVDRPTRYLTAMVADNGHTSVILWTGQGIERREDIPFNPDDPRDFHASIAPASGGLEGSVCGQPAAEPAGVLVRGSLNINPNSNVQFEFSMSTPEGVITRENLLHSSEATHYEGPATQVRVCPKGNGSQSTVSLGGVPLQNGTLYIISSQEMTVRLYNTRAHGAAMGRWWIDIAADDATITTGL